MKILSALLLSAFTLNANASESSSSTITPASPVYINLNTGFATLSNLPTGSWAGAINAGYNFNNAFAAEIGYSMIPSSQFETTTVMANVFDIAVKGTLAFSNIFSLYGRLGIGLGLNSWNGSAPTISNCILCTNDISSTYGTGLAGIGASFKLSQHFDLRIEDYGLMPFQNTYTGTVNVVTGGVQYNF